jgi:cell division initiation protein
MRITPLDVRKQEFRKAVRGLDADEVYAFLATVAEEYEVVLTDNKKLRDRVIELDEKISEYRNMEKTLRDTLLTAERVMTEARQNARKEADLILRDAQMKASQEIAGINGRVESLHQQLRELRGHRDSYLARLASLSEAQIGLVESYRRDFETTDHRIERAAEQAGVPASPGPSDDPGPATTIPAWDRGPQGPGAGAARNLPDDQWRGYSVGPPAQNFSGPRASQPPHLHTEDEGAEEMQLDEPHPAGPVADRETNSEEYGARVAAVAESWSGSVPNFEPDELSEGDARAIEEVSAAMGMFNEDNADGHVDAPGEDRDPATDPARPDSDEDGAVSDPAAADAPGLASDAVPTESVERPEGDEPPLSGEIEASAGSESDEPSEGGQSRWSLSRIARGLTGN